MIPKHPPEQRDKKNRGEFELIYFTYNFRRIINIFGYNELILGLKKLFFQLYPLGLSAQVNRTKLFFRSYSDLEVVWV
jgi:hypothetical protein